ncbi:MAG: DUF5606 domain-containing protein [Bacteroidetes bacterium]|nr:DUF5606 domain-containing protein [Bacteroidota bacterium]
MDLSGIIAISGMPGLYKVAAQAKNGIIVESLADKKRFSVSATSKVSSLDDISMFTTGDDKPVAEIMKNIHDKEKGGAAIDSKADDKAIVAYFAEILPEYDKERVYVSNMRKLFNWYNALQSTGNLKMKEEQASAEETAKPKVAEEKAKKTAAKTAKPKDTGKGTKTSAGVKKTAGVRKTGTA